jgi:hypothetical protein
MGEAFSWLYDLDLDIMLIWDDLYGINGVWDWLNELATNTGGADLSNAIPLTDSGTGVAGTGTEASRMNHRHPLNVSANEPLRDIYPGNAGSAATYARSDHAHRVNDSSDVPSRVAADGNRGGVAPNYPYAFHNHVHADKFPANEASKTSLAGTGNGANTTTWTSGGTAGLTLRTQTRSFYDTSVNPPQLYGFYRDLIYDRWGRLYNATAETRYIIATPQPEY